MKYTQNGRHNKNIVYHVMELYVKRNSFFVLYKLLYALTEKDKEKIATLTKDNDIYEKLFSIVEKLPHTQEELGNIRSSLDSYIGRINIIGAYENENFYKIRIFRCNQFDIRMRYSKIEISRVYCIF